MNLDKKQRLETLKILRQQTNISLDLCKEALTETDYDLEQALEYLKNKGLTVNRGHRSTENGKIFLATEGQKIIALILKTETDFAAQSQVFQTLGEKIAQIALKIHALSTPSLCEDQEVNKLIQLGQNTIGENIVLDHVQSYEHQGIKGVYCHQGKIASLVYVSSQDTTITEETIAKQAFNLAVSLSTRNKEQSWDQCLDQPYVFENITIGEFIKRHQLNIYFSTLINL